METWKQAEQYLKKNFIYTKQTNPKEITEPISQAVEKGSNKTAEVVKEAIESNKAMAEIELGQGVKISLPIQTKIKGETGEKGDRGEPGKPGKDGKDADEERVIREVLKRIPKERDLKKSDEDRIVATILKKIKTPSDGKDAVIDYDFIVREAAAMFEGEYRNLKPLTEFEIREIVRESVAKNTMSEKDKKDIVKMVKKEVKVEPINLSLFQRETTMGSIADVNLSNPTNGQALKYNSTTGKWENGTVSGGSGTPGGSDTQVQFNDGGSFGGDAGFTYDKTTDTLTLTSTTAQAIVQPGTNEVNIGAYSDDAVNIVANNETVSTFSGWEYGAQVLQQWWGDKTILLVSAPSASPEESTVTTMLDLGSGNKEWVDWTIEDYAGVDHKASINIAKAGTGTIVPFVIRTWDQDAGTVAAVGKEYLTITPLSEVVINESGQDVNFRVEGDTDANLIFADAGTEKVGIGTNSPSNKLHVSGSGAVTRSTNTSDSASVQAAIFEGDRATMAANDQVYVSFNLSDSAGNQDEFARVTARATDVTSTSEDARLGFSLIEAGSLTDELYLTASSLAPAASAGLNLGTSTEPFSNVFLAAGAGFNMGNGDVTVNNPSSNVLRFSGASSGFEFTDGPIIPVTSDGVALGTTTKMFSDLFLASGAVINFNNGNATLTHSAGLLTSNVALAVTPDSTSTAALTVGGGTNVGNYALSISGGRAMLGYSLSSGQMILNGGASKGLDIYVNGTSGSFETGTKAISISSTGVVTTVGNIELGHASDTTLSRSAAGVIAVEGVVIPSISSTNTLTNKRVTPRTGTTTSSATPTINTDNVDYYSLTAQTADITSFTTNLSGTPTNGQKLWISITGTAARAITWGSSFEASTIALPTTTVSTNRLDVGFIWNAATSKWRCMGTA